MDSKSLAAKLFGSLASLSAAQIVAFTLGLSFGYWVLLVIYRLTLHPLAGYPGNFIDKISIWPHIYRCIAGTRYLHQHEAHKKYGHAVRIAPNWIEFDTATAQQAIHRNRLTNVGKSQWYTMEPELTGETSLQTTIDKKEHDFRRRVLSPAFSDAALRNHEVIIADNVDNFLDKLAGKDIKKGAHGWSESKDYATWAKYFGFDFISDLSFGSSLGMMDEPSNRYIPTMLMNATQFINYIGYFPLRWVVRKFMTSPLMVYLDPNAIEATKFAELSMQKLEERQALEEKKLGRKDIFHYLINSRDPETGKGFTQQELTADSLLFLAAGSDGVSITLSAITFYMLRNPEVLANLTREVRGAFETYADIKGVKLQQLPYLAGVVSEGLRMAPAIPSSLPREVLEGGLDVDGVHLPAGTIVGVSPYQVHHNEDCFPDSFAFRPERWIESDKDDISAKKRAMCTFSAGRFDCIGKNIAITSMKLALARMVWAYDIRATNGVLTGGGSPALEKRRQRDDEYQLIDYAMAYRLGPDVQLRARGWAA